MGETDGAVLSGIRVLDVASFIAGPSCAALLAEFGAEVIKVEHPAGGDPLRRLGTPAGIGPDVLRVRNPGLILLRISGFGQEGPYAKRPGFARIAHAVGGLAHLTGEEGGPPLTPGSTSLADYMSGLYGVIGVLLALRHRDATGEGQVIDVALYESVFRALDEIAPAFALAGKVRMFARLAEVMGRPELAAADRFGPLQARLDAEAEVNGIVAEWCASRPRDEIVEMCACPGFRAAAASSATPAPNWARQTGKSMADCWAFRTARLKNWHEKG